MEHISATGADYGRIRVAGSVGFALAALLYGRLAGPAAADHVVIAMLVMLAANAVATRLVPVPSASATGRDEPQGVGDLLRRPALALLLAAGFLMQASHGAYVGFFSIALQEAGYGSDALGLAWAGAVAAEVLMMLVTGRFLTALGPRLLMGVSVAVAAFRWALYAATLAPAALVVGQALHAFTYAGFHVAAVQTIHRLVPAGRRATGQALYSGWTFGAGMMVGTAASGILKDLAGQPLMFGTASALAMGALILILLGAGRQPRGARA
jgi:PPP family 3-phenylpropionic acid transporter